MSAPTASHSRRSRASCGVAAALGALLVGCAGLPNNALGPPSAAMPVEADSTLARIVASSAPDAELSGFRLMPNGEAALDTRLELIRRAERSLDLQYYHVENDQTGRYLLRQLRDAARRGVRVRLLIDDLYTTGDDELLLGLASHPNIELRLFNPFTAGREQQWTRYAAGLFDLGRLHRRMHNKLMIADGAMAIAGGRNVGDRYFRRTAGENFIDLDTFAVGPIVQRLAALFDRYWNSPYVFPVQAVVGGVRSPDALRLAFDEATSPALAPAPRPPPPNDALGHEPLADDLAAGRLGLVWATGEAYADPPGRVEGETASYGGVPLLDVTAVRYNVVEEIRRARSAVMIASPYFIPGAVGLEVLGGIRKRGVAVTVVTNSLAATDEPLVHTGYARYREDMLRLGVNLYELSSNRARRSLRLGVFNTQLGRLHLKAAVVDGDVLYIGSMNFDPRSKYYNTEIGLIIRSSELARQVARLMELLKQQGSYRLRLDEATGALQWVADGAGEATVLDNEPDTSVWLRTVLRLLAPFAPESLL